MANYYRNDPGLYFLKNLNEEHMKTLVELLDGRWTEEITVTEEYKNWKSSWKSWKDSSPELWKVVAAEIQYFGGNTLANIFRGSGVLYKEILCDVCDSMKVNYNKNSSIERIEEQLLCKVFTDTVEKMQKDPEKKEELEKLLKESGLSTKEILKNSAATGGVGGVVLFQAIMSLGGIHAYYVLNAIIHAVAWQALGHGLKWGATAPVMHWVSVFAGPVGWAISSALTVALVATPAMRVTIPVTITLACMRRLQNLTSDDSDDDKACV